MAKFVIVIEDMPDNKTKFEAYPSRESMMAKLESGEIATEAEHLGMVAIGAISKRVKEMIDKQRQSIQPYMGEINNEISAKEAEIVKAVNRKGGRNV